MGIDPSAKTARDFTIGIYPLLVDETCWFLAADFDKDTWTEDITAFLEICHAHNVPAILERSRSGNGGHVWVFFSEPIPARLARRLGSYLLTRTMENRPEIGLDSYDRFFPNQDTMPKGGFGNLIALPLQNKPRSRNNSVFVNENFEPYPDQWAFLSSVRQMTRREVEAIVDEASTFGGIIGIRLTIADEEDDEPWTIPPSRRRKEKPITTPLSESISLVLGNQIYIPKEELTPQLKNRLIRLAAFQNPEFYKAQTMRLSTFDKPRIIGCAEDFPNHIGLPRGCLDDVIELLQHNKIKVEITDERFPGNPIDVQFQGELRPAQQDAAQAMLSNNTGILSAPTGFGKTVITVHMISERKTNTLVLVHRKQLLHQWITHLTNFLDLSASQIGQIGGGKRKPSRVIDIATIQSLWRKNVVNDIVGEYGYLIIDECHHISAWSFRKRRQAKQGQIRNWSISNCHPERWASSHHIYAVWCRSTSSR